MADKRDATGYIIIFSVALCAFFSLVLSGIQSGLKPMQDLNKKIDTYQNILEVLGVNIYTDEAKTIKISPDETEKLYEKLVSEILIDSKTGKVVEGKIKVRGKDQDPLYINLTKTQKKDGDYLPVWILKDKDGKVKTYAISVYGQGLWGLMWGYLAIDSDLKTVVGITFTDHKETPGLGAEVDQAWFKKQFTKEAEPLYIRDENGKLARIELVKGGESSKFPAGHVMRNFRVDGISGATITANGLNKFINEGLEKYEQNYFSKLKK